MDKILELLKESVLMQGTLALACLGTIIYLTVTGQPIPDIISNAFALILGFYFGSKSIVEARKLTPPSP